MRFLDVFAVVVLSAVGVGAEDLAEIGRRCQGGDGAACGALAAAATTDKKVETRTKAVTWLKDQDVLARIATSDRDASVRAEAVRLLTTSEVLERVATSDTDAKVRRLALHNPALAGRAADIAPLSDPEVTRTLEDQGRLERIARGTSVPHDVRLAAILALTDAARLEALATSPDLGPDLKVDAEQRFLTLRPAQAATFLFWWQAVDSARGHVKAPKNAWPAGCADASRVNIRVLLREYGPAGTEREVWPTNAVHPSGQPSRLLLSPGRYVAMATYVDKHDNERSKELAVPISVKGGHTYCIAAKWSRAALAREGVVVEIATTPSTMPSATDR